MALLWKRELQGPPEPPALRTSPLCTERGGLGSFSPSDRLSHVFLALPKLPSLREFETQGSLGQASSLPSAFLSKTRYISQCLLNHAYKHQLGLTQSMALSCCILLGTLKGSFSLPGVHNLKDIL